MFQHQSFYFYLIYVTIIIVLSLKLGRYLQKKVHVDITSKNTVLLTHKRILKTVKESKNKEKLFGFPHKLDIYIKEPTNDLIANILIETFSKEKTDEIYDMYRCITIASVIYKTPIPLHLICIDTRTRELYNFLLSDLELKYVLILDRHKQKIKEAVNNNVQDMITLNNKFHYRIAKVGKVILDYSEKNMFPSIIELTHQVNLNLDESEQLTQLETKSLATAFSAITMVKIPHIYINCDMLAMVLMHFVFEKK